MSEQRRNQTALPCLLCFFQLPRKIGIPCLCLSPRWLLFSPARIFARCLLSCNLSRSHFRPPRQLLTAVLYYNYTTAKKLPATYLRLSF